MKLIFKIIVLLVAFCNGMKAQKTPDSILLRKAKLEIYDNPDNTIKIGEQLLKNLMISKLPLIFICCFQQPILLKGILKSLFNIF